MNWLKSEGMSANYILILGELILARFHIYYQIKPNYYSHNEGTPEGIRKYEWKQFTYII